MTGSCAVGREEGMDGGWKAVLVRMGQTGRCLTISKAPHSRLHGMACCLPPASALARAKWPRARRGGEEGRKKVERRRAGEMTGDARSGMVAVTGDPVETMRGMAVSVDS